MASNLDAAILGAKGIMINGLNNPNVFHLYDKPYFWTNEFVNTTLNIAEISGKTNALSVLASGDQAFSMLAYGVKNIDTFDINALTEFYALGFKRAMILKYNYQEFMAIINKVYYNMTPEETYDLIWSLFPYMETRHRKFWEAMIDFDWSLRAKGYCGNNIIDALTRDFYMCIPDDVTYLISEERYNEVRDSLSSANISFKVANASELDSYFDGTYEFIYLSNILDYFTEYFGKNWGYKRLADYEKQIRKLATKDATIILKYKILYSRIKRNNQGEHSLGLFKDSDFIVDDYFKDETVASFSAGEYREDAVVLLRGL